MKTSRLYYEDCYTSLFKAEPVEIDREGQCIYLDKTFFYPTSGGQPHDTGWIDGIPVTDVVDKGSGIAHRLAAPLTLKSSPLDCRLNWPRRYDHMQQHTGQHLLSAVFVALFSFKTLSFHMGEEVSTIEIATDKLEDGQIDAAERRAAELIAEARPVRISYEEAEEVAGLRKPSARSGTLRIVTIEGYDRSACGGTHLHSTAEIGPLQIRSLERVRGNVRLQFVCGVRAMAAAKQDFRLLTNLSKALAVQPGSLADHISGLRSQLESKEKSLLRATAQLAEKKAARLYQMTPMAADGIRRCSVVSSEGLEAARALAVAFARLPGGLILIGPDSIPGTVILACSGKGLHAGNLWQSAFAAGGGKGGGSATLAQGNVTDQVALDRLLAAAGLSGPLNGG